MTPLMRIRAMKSHMIPQQPPHTLRTQPYGNFSADHVRGRARCAVELRVGFAQVLRLKPQCTVCATCPECVPPRAVHYFVRVPIDEIVERLYPRGRAIDARTPPARRLTLHVTETLHLRRRREMRVAVSSIAWATTEFERFACVRWRVEGRRGPIGRRRGSA